MKRKLFGVTVVVAVIVGLFVCGAPVGAYTVMTDQEMGSVRGMCGSSSCTAPLSCAGPCVEIIPYWYGKAVSVLAKNCQPSDPLFDCTLEDVVCGQFWVGTDPTCYFSHYRNDITHSGCK